MLLKYLLTFILNIKSRKLGFLNLRNEGLIINGVSDHWHENWVQQTRHKVRLDLRLNELLSNAFKLGVHHIKLSCFVGILILVLFYGI